MKRAVLGTVAIALIMLMSFARAGDRPEAVISQMTERVLAEAAQPGGQADAAKIRNLVETVILPNVDFQAMTSRAVGLKWRSATEEQRSQLMRLSVAARENVRRRIHAGQWCQVPYGPRDGDRRRDHGNSGRDRYARKQPTDCDGLQDGTRNGSWMVVDVSVAGVWLVAAYRSQFAQVLQNGDVDSLIHSLQEKAGKKAAT